MQKIGDILVLNLSESSTLLGVSTATFQLLRRQDDFPLPIRLNRRNLWVASDLREWAESRIGRNTARPHTDEDA